MKTRLTYILWIRCILFLAVLFHAADSMAMDSDLDGMTDTQEVIAGTDPFDADSYFKVTMECIQTNGADHVQVGWDSNVGVVYNVEWTPSLNLNFSPVASGLKYPSSSFCTPADAEGAKGFYRVIVQLESYDADGDGLPNSWESEHFGSTTSAVLSADIDGDGQDNLSEYIAGSDPADATSTFEITSHMSSTTNGVVIEWNSLPGRQYSVYCCTDLTCWFEPLATGIKYPTNTYVDTSNNGEHCVFYQVRVSMQKDSLPAILELPVQHVDLDPTKLQEAIPVVNGGTEPLTWNASTDTPWLQVLTPVGLVAPESEAGWLTIEADPQGLSGQPEGVVTVVGGGVSMDITVKLKLDDIVLEAITIEGSSYAFEHAENAYVAIGHFSGGGAAPVEASWSEDSGYSSINPTGLLSVEELETDQEAMVTAVYEGIEVSKEIILKDVSGSAPYPRPNLPESFSPFDVPYVEIGNPSSVPAIAEWSRSGGPGESITLTGSRLSVLTGGGEGQDTGYLVFGQSGADKVTANANVLTISGMKSALTLPADMPADAMYMIWPENNNGYGNPIALNATQAWWVGPDKVTRGEQFSVYGNNLVADNASSVSHAYIQTSSGSGFWLTSESATPYKADFRLPANTVNGSYTVWVHNGRGQHLGWGRPLALEVEDGMVWDGPTLDVTQAPYYAKGNGVDDDSAAIIAALDDCPLNGTVYFPAGTYMIGSSLYNIAGHKRLLGDGPENTVITSHQNFQNEPMSEGIIHSTVSHVEITEMTFSTGQYPKGAVVRLRGARNLLISNVHFTSLDSDPAVLVSKEIVDFAHSENVRFKNCEFIAHKNLFGGSSRQVFIEDCDFYGIHENNKLIAMGGAVEVSITGCTGQSYDNSDYTSSEGWCQGRFIYGSGNGGPMWNWYIGENTTTDMCPRYDYNRPQYNGGQIDQNTGEQLMWEGLATRHKQHVTSATKNTVRLAGLDRDFTDYRMVIVEGTGLGQSRQVSGTFGEVLTLDQDWKVIPDSSSVVMIGSYGAHFLIYGNNLDGTARTYAPGSSNYTATAGVNFYGGFQNSIVVSNNIQEVRTGMFEFSLAEHTVEAGKNTIQPTMFNTFMNNRITNTRIGIGSASLTFKDPVNQDDLAITGTVWRNNRIEGAREIAMAVAQTETEFRIENCVFDKNLVLNSPVEVDVSGPAENQIFIDP